MAPGVYGSIVADKDIPADETDAVVRSLVSRKNSQGRMVESPFKHFALPPLFKIKELTTHIVRLSPEFDSVRKILIEVRKATSIRHGKKCDCAAG